MNEFAANVRRVMARQGLTLQQVVEATGLNERTVKGLLSGKNKPHARTLHRLAAGLGISTDEFFQHPASLALRTFDRQTNPVLEQLVASRPDLFKGWTPADFDELYSRFGTGGALTESGAAQTVAAMNQNRDIHQKVALLLETCQADLVISFVDLLYKKILVTST